MIEKELRPQSSALTTVAHWDAAREAPIRLRLPSGLLCSTLDFRRVIRRWVRPGNRVLEIGFAPGKQLAWVAKALGASVAGIDYSAPGVEMGRRLFAHLQLDGDLRCEDIFNTTFPAGSFDVVYSVGVVEHFRDPTQIIRQHFELLSPGGAAVIIVPNYRGIYGRLQARLDPANLALHNLDIMDKEQLVALAPSDLAGAVSARYAGRVSASLLSLHHILPEVAASMIFWGVNALALLQPFDVASVAPWLVCEGRRLG